MICQNFDIFLLSAVKLKISNEDVSNYDVSNRFLRELQLPTIEKKMDEQRFATEGSTKRLPGKARRHFWHFLI